MDMQGAFIFDYIMYWSQICALRTDVEYGSRLLDALGRNASSEEFIYPLAQF